MRKLLCVEDNQDASEILSFVFERGGYEVITASSFAEARDLVGQQNFDGYIIDENLPDGKGCDLCSEIRARNLEAPILVISADARPAVKERALKAGAQSFFPKPLDPFAILHTIDDQV